jgi:hypothetical protein
MVNFTVSFHGPTVFDDLPARRARLPFLNHATVAIAFVDPQRLKPFFFLKPGVGQVLIVGFKKQILVAVFKIATLNHSHPIVDEDDRILGNPIVIE